MGAVNQTHFRRFTKDETWADTIFSWAFRWREGSPLKLGRNWFFANFCTLPIIAFAAGHLKRLLCCSCRPMDIKENRVDQVHILAMIMCLLCLCGPSLLVWLGPMPYDDDADYGRTWDLVGRRPDQHNGGGGGWKDTQITQTRSTHHFHFTFITFRSLYIQMDHSPRPTPDCVSAALDMIIISHGYLIVFCSWK